MWQLYASYLKYCRKERVKSYEKEQTLNKFTLINWSQNASLWQGTCRKDKGQGTWSRRMNVLTKRKRLQQLPRHRSQDFSPPFTEEHLMFWGGISLLITAFHRGDINVLRWCKFVEKRLENYLYFHLEYPWYCPLDSLQIVFSQKILFFQPDNISRWFIITLVGCIFSPKTQRLLCLFINLMGWKTHIW